QINCALYQDDSLWVVPGSHARDDTPEERAAFPDGEPTAPSFQTESNEERERMCLAYCRRMPGAVRVHLDPGDLCVYRGTLWHMGNYVPYAKRATIIDLIDTPAYAEFRTRAGLDKELADRTTTRSMKADSGSPEPGAGDRNAGEAREVGAQPFAGPASANGVVGQPSSEAVTLPEPVHVLIAE